MEKFLYEKQITAILVTPSYVKNLCNISPYLDTIAVGGEPANDLFVKQYDTFMESESANIVKEYYKKNYLDKYDFDIKMLGLTPDSMDFSLKVGYVVRKLDIKRSDLQKCKIFNKMRNNVFFMLCCIFAMLRKDGKNKKLQNDLYKKAVDIENKNAMSDGVIGFEVIDNDDMDSIMCNIDYAATIYKKSTIEKFFSIFNDTVDKMSNIEDMSKTLVLNIFDEIK